MRRTFVCIWSALALCVALSFVGSYGTAARADQTSSPSPSPSPTPTPFPINFAQHWADQGRSPVEVYKSFTGRDGNKRPEQCVSFRNITPTVATNVTFGFVYVDNSSAAVPLVTQTYQDAGSFTPPIAIDQHCSKVNLGAKRTLEHIASVDIHVLSVTFQDGMQWTSGQGFTRAFANDGSSLAKPLSVAASSPFALPPVFAVGSLKQPLNINQNWADLGRSPIEVLSSSTTGTIGAPSQCVSFRNVSGQAATNVRFAFDYVGPTKITQMYNLAGTFTPPIEIDNKCTAVNLGSAQVATAIQRVDIHVLTVMFADGSVWSSGDKVDRKYQTNGNPI